MQLKKLPWGRGIFISLAKTLTLIAIIGGSFFLLNSGVNTFTQIYGSSSVVGSLSNLALEQWKEIYGGSITQNDLQVTQYITVMKDEIIPSNDPTAKPIYRQVISKQSVNQKCIYAFRGDVDIDVSGAENNEDSFNGYSINAAYEYDIWNTLNEEMHVRFRFPLSYQAKLFTDILVQIDGVDTSWKMQGKAMIWETTLAPAQHVMVRIQYKTLGQNSYTFYVPQSRDITDFKFNVVLDTNRYGIKTQPDNGGIQVTEEKKDTDSFVTWEIDQAIISPNIGIYFRQGWPYAPYQDMTVTLPLAARASVFFLTLAVITLLVCKIDVRIPTLAYLAALFMLPFLLLLSGRFPYLANLDPAQYSAYQLKMLPVISLLSVALSFFTLRGIPKFPKILILLLLFLFISGYPLVGLLDEQKRNGLETIIQAGMIAYIFIITLVIRLRRGKGQEPNAE